MAFLTEKSTTNFLLKSPQTNFVSKLCAFDRHIKFTKKSAKMIRIENIFDIFRVADISTGRTVGCDTLRCAPPRWHREAGRKNRKQQKLKPIQESAKNPTDSGIKKKIQKLGVIKTDQKQRNDSGIEIQKSQIAINPFRNRQQKIQNSESIPEPKKSGPISESIENPKRLTL